VAAYFLLFFSASQYSNRLEEKDTAAFHKYKLQYLSNTLSSAEDTITNRYKKQ
jgi:hypothetical protein